MEEDKNTPPREVHSSAGLVSSCSVAVSSNGLEEERDVEPAQDTVEEEPAGTEETPVTKQKKKKRRRKLTGPEEPPGKDPACRIHRPLLVLVLSFVLVPAEKKSKTEGEEDGAKLNDETVEDEDDGPELPTGLTGLKRFLLGRFNR